MEGRITPGDGSFPSAEDFDIDKAMAIFKLESINLLDEIMALSQMGAVVRFQGQGYIQVIVSHPVYTLYNPIFYFNVLDKEKCATFLRRTRILLGFEIRLRFRNSSL
jgi:hypothetical protein